MKIPSLCLHKLSNHPLSRVLMKDGAPEGPSGSPRDVLDAFYKENGVLSGQEAWDYMQTEKMYTSAETRAVLDSLKKEIEVPKDVLDFVDKNRKYLEGAIGVAIAQMHEAHDKKFPGDAAKANRHFHTTSTFFHDPKIQEMFRLYKATTANGKKYIETFVDCAPGMNSDLYPGIFIGTPEEGRTDGMVLNWPE